MVMPAFAAMPRHMSAPRPAPLANLPRFRARGAAVGGIGAEVAATPAGYGDAWTVN